MSAALIGLSISLQYCAAAAGDELYNYCSTWNEKESLRVALRVYEKVRAHSLQSGAPLNYLSHFLVSLLIEICKYAVATELVLVQETASAKISRYSDYNSR